MLQLLIHNCILSAHLQQKIMGAFGARVQSMELQQPRASKQQQNAVALRHCILHTWNTNYTAFYHPSCLCYLFHFHSCVWAMSWVAVPVCLQQQSMPTSSMCTLHCIGGRCTACIAGRIVHASNFYVHLKLAKLLTFRKRENASCRKSWLVIAMQPSTTHCSLILEKC
jgi:hypothetical protein